MEYEILHNGQRAGKAEVKEAGLYYMVRCICKNSNEVQRIVARCKCGEESIGICVPAGGHMEVSAKIPKKRLQNLVGFYVTEAVRNKKWLPLKEGQPVESLEEILGGRLIMREGQIGVEL